MASDPTERYPAAITALLIEFGPSLLAVFAVSLVLAILVWQTEPVLLAFPKREQVAWSVFVLLFGLPAYVGFRLGRRWPIRLPCPSCHARAPRDRPARARSAELASRILALKGTEIFA